MNVVTRWRLFYHLVWATKNREPLIDDQIEPVLQRSFRATCHEMRVVVHAIGMMPDHVHLAVSIPPNIAISDAARRLKGSASHLVNAAGGRSFAFGWQAEYGVHSFGERNLSEVIGYVENQQAHHAADRLWAALEPGNPVPTTRQTSTGEAASRRPMARLPEIPD